MTSAIKQEFFFKLLQRPQNIVLLLTIGMCHEIETCPVREKQLQIVFVSSKPAISSKNDVKYQLYKSMS